MKHAKEDNVETFTEETGKKIRTPRQYDSILAGVLKLSLEDRVKIKKENDLSIVNELEEKRIDYEVSSKLVNGKD